jgi:hypothetical protein
VEELIKLADFYKTSSFNAYNFILSIFLSCILSYLLKLTSDNISKTTFLEQEFKKSLIILPLIVMSIIYFVGASLTLSIGLLGSLSIIRFRTSIKSPYELILILIAIMIGIGIGSQNFVETSLLSIFVFFTIIIIERYNDSSASFDYIISLRSKDRNVYEKLAQSHLKFEIVSIEEDAYLIHVNLNQSSIEDITSTLEKNFTNISLNKLND